MKVTAYDPNEQGERDMKNPFRNRKKEAVVAHTTVPKDWFSMTMEERLDWAGQLLGGLAPDVEEVEPQSAPLEYDGFNPDCTGYEYPEESDRTDQEEERDGDLQEFADGAEVTSCRGYGLNPPSQDDTDKS